MKKYIRIIIISFKKNSVYKWSCVIDTITSLLSIYMLLCFWDVLYTKRPEQIIYMTKYVIISALVNVMLSFSSPDQLASRIRSGDICVDILKPWNLIISYFCEDFGANIVKCVTKVLPMILFCCVFIANVFVSIEAAIFLCVSTFLSMVIIYLSKICVSMICFWITEAWSIQILFDTIILVLSGRMIPSWIYPTYLESIFNFFPYVWTIQKPLEVYMSMRDKSIIAGCQVFLVQIFWIGILGVVAFIMWSKAYRKVTIQGG